MFGLQPKFDMPKILQPKLRQKKVAKDLASQI
jgi:hypothetical protein